MLLLIGRNPYPLIRYSIKEGWGGIEFLGGRGGGAGVGVGFRRFEAWAVVEADARAAGVLGFRSFTGFRVWGLGFRV